MKISYIYTLAICLVFFFLQSCDPEAVVEVDERAQTIERLTGTWNASQVTIDNSDPASDFSSFSLYIDENLKYVTNAFELGLNTSLWPSSGSFTFGGTSGSPDFNTMIRDDGLIADVSLNGAGDRLVMSFNFDMGDARTDGGRVKVINGDWIFTFEK